MHENDGWMLASADHSIVIIVFDNLSPRSSLSVRQSVNFVASAPLPSRVGLSHSSVGGDGEGASSGDVLEPREDGLVSYAREGRMVAGQHRPLRRDRRLRQPQSTKVSVCPSIPSQPSDRPSVCSVKQSLL